MRNKIINLDKKQSVKIAGTWYNYNPCSEIPMGTRTTCVLGTGGRMKYIMMVIAILVLNLLDIHNTLKILSYGGTELNPIMDYFIQMEAILFGFVKMFLTSTGLFVLYLYKKEYLKYILLLYMTLIVYQNYLLNLLDLY